MSKSLNVFTDYTYEEHEGEGFIKYINNKPISLCSSTWVKFLYPIMQKTSELMGESIDIPCIDEFDNADLAKVRKLNLIEPEKMVKALELTKEYYESLERTEEIENMLYYIDNVLLNNARSGFYFSADRD